MPRSATLMCLVFALSGCAVPITDIVVSPVEARSAGQRARSRVENRALQICADVARQHGLEGTVGHYESSSGLTIDIRDEPPPDLISIRVRRPLLVPEGEGVATDLAYALQQHFGAGSVRTKRDVWVDY